MPTFTETEWLETLSQQTIPSSTEDVVNAVEQFKTATTSEPYSMRIWLRYCEFLSSVYEQSQSWEKEERLLCAEVFDEGTIQAAWDTALDYTRYRINDSHILWNSWLSYRMTYGSPNPQEVCSYFEDRLQVPSSAWNETSQQYSSYLSQNFQERYEEAMIEVTQLAKLAKTQYAEREQWELKLNALDDAESRKALYADYLQFELTRSRKAKQENPLLIVLYERTLLEFPAESSIWEEYIIAMGRGKQDQEVGEIVPTLERALEHCPTAQVLWTRYLLLAEMCGMDLSKIQDIVDRAIQPQNLLSLSDAVLIYSAWCGYLTRNVAPDLVSDGIMTAINNLHKFQQVDPTFSVERILIEFLTAQRDVDGARVVWEKTSKTHSTSYDFWQQYAEWENAMEQKDLRRPKVKLLLERAIKKSDLDWPEKVIELYSRHCTLHEDVAGLLAAKDFIHKSQKFLIRRRQREAAIYSAQQARHSDDNSAVLPKRKRENSAESENKRVKAGHGDEAMQAANSPGVSSTDGELHRDREHLSLLVTNLPPEVTITQVKKFFKGYGSIQEPIQLIKGGTAINENSSALVEFRSSEDVATALLRDMKPLENTGIAISVKPALDLTLYVTNFPDSEFGKDEFIYKMFGQYGQLFPPRWPNKEKRLMANLKRRFVYLSYTTSEAAAAALDLDGKEIVLEENMYSRFTMIVKYSNPKIKKKREEKKAVKKPKFETKQNDHKLSAEQEDTNMGGLDESIQNPPSTKHNSISTETVVKVQAKPKTAKFMPQGPVRRPVLAGPKKRGGFSKS